MEFYLRPFEKSDAESIAWHANNKKIADNVRNQFPHPYSVQDAEEFIGDCIQKGDEKQLIRAIVIDGEAVGCVGIILKEDVYSRSAEIGYWLSETYWGNGIASGAAGQILELGFERYDIVRVFSEVFEYNKASCRVLEKAGFTLEGILRKSVTKNGRTFDSCIYALVKG